MFTGGLVWLFIGALTVLVGVSAKMWADDLKLNMTWWKWLLSAMWYVMLAFAIAMPFTMWGEGETKAGWISLLFLGAITLILGVGLGRLLWMGRTGSSKPETVELKTKAGAAAD